jgi:cytochrome c
MRNWGFAFAIPRYLMSCMAWVAGLTFISQAWAQSSDVGKTQFLTSCGVCHSTDAGAPNRQGPNLGGVYGRKVGQIDNFKYSDALKNGDWIWNDTTLDSWLENSQEAHPGTVMNYRQANPEKRQIVIDYLKSLSPAK